jgi:hypothetical protein
MNHEEAWTRLPDLLEDRDDPVLLAHVRACEACQRQLFLLGRVDRLLRERAQAPTKQGQRWWRSRHALALAAAAAAAAAVAVVLFPPGQAQNAELTFRTGSGRAVGHAIMGHADARNLTLALSARGLSVRHGQAFVLWASGKGESMQVGHFMVDHHGACRARFNLPATNNWQHFWIAHPGSPETIIAST